MLEYNVDSIFDPSSPYYIGGAFSGNNPGNQNSFLDKTNPLNIGSGEIGEDVQLRAAAAFRSGQTDFNTGVGFWLGADNGTPKFSIGDSAGDHISWDGDSFDVVGISTVVKRFTAGEDLTVGDSVFIATGSEVQTVGPDTGDTGTFDTITADADYIAKILTTPAETGSIQITGVTLRAGRGAGTTGSLTCAIRATSGGQPTGSDLRTGTVTLLSMGSDEGSVLDINLSSPLTVTGGTKYAVVFYTTAGASPVFFTYEAGGAGDTYTSANSGGSWSDANHVMGLIGYFTFATAGRVYKTNAGSYTVYTGADTSQMVDSFIGFVKTTTSRAGMAPVTIAGEVTGLTGISPGANYYVADGFGTIATSVGTVSRKVGIGLSTTSLLITNVW